MSCVHGTSSINVSPAANMANEDVSWDYQNLIPLHASEKRALKPRQIWAIGFFLDQYGRTRDRALFDLAIDSKLRGCDLVKIKIGDIVCDRKIRTRWLELRGGSLRIMPSRAAPIIRPT